MSFDLCFWKSGTASPKELYNDACEGIEDRLAASEDVLQFRSEVLSTWSTFADLIEPPDYDPDAEEQSALDRYVLLTVPSSLLGELSDIVKLARRYGLTIYNPQVEQVLLE